MHPEHDMTGFEPMNFWTRVFSLVQKTTLFSDHNFILAIEAGKKTKKIRFYKHQNTENKFSHQFFCNRRCVHVGQKIIKNTLRPRYPAGRIMKPENDSLALIRPDSLSGLL